MFSLKVTKIHVVGKSSYEKGLTGEEAKQFKADVIAHNGEVSGYKDFNGMQLYEVIDGACFHHLGDWKDFRNKFPQYNARPCEPLTPGIKGF